MCHFITLDTGPTGPTGTAYNRSAYIVTFNDSTSAEGIPVTNNDRLPLDRLELDISNLVTLNSDEETLKFNVAGYYKITFIISGYAQQTDTEFDLTKDFISIGFRQVDTDNIFIGASEWVYYEKAVQITGQGIIAVNDITNTYELVNLAPQTLYLDTPDLGYISTGSYFANALVTMIVEYLGRQGA